MMKKIITGIAFCAFALVSAQKVDHHPNQDPIDSKESKTIPYGNKVLSKGVYGGDNLSSGVIVILDGNRISEKEMHQIDPQFIEKIEVLKDESATKIFGEEGKKGAIIITTKKEIPSKDDIKEEIETRPILAI